MVIPASHPQLFEKSTRRAEVGDKRAVTAPRVRRLFWQKRRTRHDPASAGVQLRGAQLVLERPMHLLCRFLAVLLLVAAHAGAGQAQAPACTGKNVLDELREDDAAAHARVIAAAEDTENANAILWRLDKDGAPPSHLFGTMHLTDDRINALSPAVTNCVRGLAPARARTGGPVARQFHEGLHRLPAAGGAHAVHRRPPPRSASGS